MLLYIQTGPQRNRKYFIIAAIIFADLVSASKTCSTLKVVPMWWRRPWEEAVNLKQDEKARKLPQIKRDAMGRRNHQEIIKQEYYSSSISRDTNIKWITNIWWWSAIMKCKYYPMLFRLFYTIQSGKGKEKNTWQKIHFFDLQPSKWHSGLFFILSINTNDS